MTAAALVAVVGAPVSIAKPSAELQVARTVMADAAPSSFAIGLPHGVNICYDPVRGGVNYAWKGGFADLTPARPGTGKLIKPVTLLGDVVYRENGSAPLRRGDASRPPVVVFKGYRLEPAAIEFHYTVDEILVHERVSSRPAGDGFIRQFRIDPSDRDAAWWYLPGGPETASLTSPTGQREGAGFRFDPGSTHTFSIEVVFPSAQP